jgi:rubrerythrin
MNDHIANHLLSLSMIALPLAWQEKNESSGTYWSVQVRETVDSIPASSDGNSSSEEPRQRLPLPENEVEEKQPVGAWMDAQELAEPEDMSANLSKPDFTIASPGSDDGDLTVEDDHLPENLSSLSTLQHVQSSTFAASATISEEAGPVESKKDRIKLEAGGHRSSHGHSSSSHHHSSSRGQSSKSDKKHKKDRESGGSNDTKQPKAGCHWEWFWACHECGQSAGLTQHTNYCPDCTHLRCTDCPGDWVEIRDAI